MFFSGCLCLNLKAQTPAKEAMNNFARYTNKSEFSFLEKAKKNIDEAFKTKRDSSNYSVNITRGLIYASLAYADSNRKIMYVKDPLFEGLFSLEKLNNTHVTNAHQPEIKLIRNQLANGWLIKARRSLMAINYKEAYKAYIWVDSLSTDKFTAKHNLAIVSEKLGYTDQAIQYYSYLIADTKRAVPDYYLVLSNLFEQTRNSMKAFSVVKDGRKAFPGNKDLLFKEVNNLADIGSHELVAELIDDALAFAPDNLDLLYLAGFSFEMIGQNTRAEEYYKKIISLENNNYEGNYALGLLYLNAYLKPANTGNKHLLDNSTRYLAQAEEINPNAINVLKSLRILYTIKNNAIELKRVNNKLNQIILN